MIQSDTIQITPEILALIARIDEFRRAWRAMGELSPEQRSPLRGAAMLESIGSSMRIEGSEITDLEVERVLSSLSTRLAGSFPTREEHEAAGYAEPIKKVFSSWRAIPFTEARIRQMHRDLLAYSEKDAWHRGSYRETSINTSNSGENGARVGTVFQAAAPLDVAHLMAELIGWLKEEQAARRLHSLLIIALWVVVFLKIHPFQDGNGPLSRMLTTLLLLQSGYEYVQYSSLESVIEGNKEAYFTALHQTQETIGTGSPNWQPWLVFFLRSLAQQVTRLEKKIEHNSEPRD